MSEASPHLRRVVDVFRNNGISNEVRIAEHVAFLLLVRDHWDTIRQNPQDAPATLQRLHEGLSQQHSGISIPAAPSLNIDALFNVVAGMEAAVSASPYSDSDDLGQFFQRELRFELLKATSGSQYPTPHHVAMLMAQVSVTEQTEDVLDLTAGTGGLLVAAHQQKPGTQIDGVDFDPQWVGLASANLILNGALSARMRVEQALNLYDHPAFAEQFDTVLMNPPFGGTRSAQEIEQTVGRDFGRTSSTVLAALALHMLKPDGIVAFLQPSGLLFGSGGEAHLRHVLMQNHALEAVITLPPDAMQPYSQVATHLLVARKAAPSDAVWFITLTSDGYPAGTARDLTAEPNTTQNDFPRARDVVLKTRAGDWETRLALDGIGDVQTIKLGDALPGLGIRVTAEPEKIQWRVSHFNDGVLVKLRNAEDTLLGWFYEPYRDGDVLSFTIGQAQQFAWKDRLSQDAWEIDEQSTWQAGSDDVTLEVNPQNQQITLQRNKTKFVFSSDNNANLAASACLLDEQGKPVTSWMSITEERRESDIRDNDFGADVGATGISDAQGNLIGWLLDLTLTEGDQEHQATLLIITEPEAELFTTDGDTCYALIDDGWLEVTLDGSITTSNGSPVRLRDEVTQGFAIGPAPSSEEVSHSLFGVLVPSSVFVQDGKVGDMRPSSFLPEPEAAPLGHPLDVLASIRRSQTQLSGKVDSLLGILGQSGRYDKTAETLASIPAWIEVILSDQQRRVLELLKAQVVKGKPRHFNEADVAGWCEADGIAYSVDDVQQQLRLFIRLGLVKAVHTNGHNLYRMITTADVQQATEETQ